MRFLASPFLAALLFECAGCGAGASSHPPPLAAGGNLPDIALERVDGKGYVHLKNLARGKVMVVVFWATWCDSCKGELVGLKSFYEQYRVRGIEVLAVSMDTPESAAEVRLEVHRFSMPYLVVFDTESLASASLNPTGTAPFTVVVSRGGNVAFSHEGYLSGDLERIKEAALDALGD